jgi:hypothetical protein
MGSLRGCPDRICVANRRQANLGREAGRFWKVRRKAQKIVRCCQITCAQKASCVISSLSKWDGGSMASIVGPDRRLSAAEESMPPFLLDPWGSTCAAIIGVSAALPKILREVRLLIREVRGRHASTRRRAPLE